MNLADRQSLQATARWLIAHTRFPAVRLDPRAEALVCIALLAEREAAAQRPGHRFQVRPGSQASMLRQHALRRSQVHFKCDNSAKV